MRLDILFKSLVLGLALALIGWALLPASGLLDLVKLVAVAVGAATITAFAYPHFRGVQRGDSVLVLAEGEMPFAVFKFKTGVAQTSGRVGQKIKVSFPDGTEAEAVVTGYAGILTPAQAKITEEAYAIKVM